MYVSINKSQLTNDVKSKSKFLCELYKNPKLRKNCLVLVCIQSKCGKIPTRITPNKDPFQVVQNLLKCGFTKLCRRVFENTAVPSLEFYWTS